MQRELERDRDNGRQGRERDAEIVGESQTKAEDREGRERQRELESDKIRQGRKRDAE